MFDEIVENTCFPNPLVSARDDGPMAIGGDLSNEMLDQAYSIGAFPFWAYYDHDGYEWWCPRKRYVIFPEQIHISHSMRQLIKSGKYRVSVNEDFDGVIDGCSTVQGRDEEKYCWLKGEIIDAYKRYHREGHAMSVEVWDGERLVGGLYGGMLGNCFAGESMFSLVPSASKLALIHVAKMLQGTGKIIDCHFETDHLRSMGGRFMLLEDFQRILKHKFTAPDTLSRLAERYGLMQDEALLKSANHFPVYKCYRIDTSWSDQFRKVFISRKIDNDSLIVVEFLIDTWHQGIKDIQIITNSDTEHYNYILGKYNASDKCDTKEIQYSEAHAWVYKARQWGKAAGMDKDRCFSLASYILDKECDEADKLMDSITMGRNGKHYIIAYSLEDFEKKKALADKKFGEGNYEIAIEEDD